MTYREMLDLLRSKGVRVDEDRNGFKADGEEGLMKYWMVRVKGDGDDMFMFCCGFDMLGNGRLVISHKDYPMDENIFESLQDAIKRNEGEEYPADHILLMPDLDYYTTADAEREMDEEERKWREMEHVDLVITSNDDANLYTFVALGQEHGTVLSGSMEKLSDHNNGIVILTADIRHHFDRKEVAEQRIMISYDLKKFYADAEGIIQHNLCDLCELVGAYVGRVFTI